VDTCFNYCSDKGFFSTDEKKWITKIHKLKEAYPDQVTITQEPNTNDGCLVCSLPASWFKIKPPVVMNLSEEERLARAERLHKNLNK